MNNKKTLEMIKTLIEKAVKTELAELKKEFTDSEKAIKAFADIHNLNKSLEALGIKGGCDIIDRNDYIATKLWCRDDVKEILIEKGYAGTENEIDEVINTGRLETLGDCTDEDWEIIDSAIWEADKCCSFTNPSATDNALRAIGLRRPVCSDCLNFEERGSYCTYWHGHTSPVEPITECKRSDIACDYNFLNYDYEEDDEMQYEINLLRINAYDEHEPEGKELIEAILAAGGDLSKKIKEFINEIGENYDPNLWSLE